MAAVKGSGAERAIIDAAIEAVRTRGAAGASARTIAQIGGFGQALIYYHFGSLNELLIASLEFTSLKRLDRYRKFAETVGSLEELVSTGRELFREDVASGHITVLSELVAACLTRPEMGPEVMRCLTPWIDLTQHLIDRFLKGSSLEGFVESRDAAQALMAFYMGMEMLYHLDQDAERSDRLFGMFSRFVPLLSPMIAPAESPGS
jgi:AcrR family transcriptional regulator